MPEPSKNAKEEAEERCLSGLLRASLGSGRNESGGKDSFLQNLMTTIDGEVAAGEALRRQAFLRIGLGTLAAVVAIGVFCGTKVGRENSSAIIVTKAEGEVFARMPGKKLARQVSVGDFLHSGEEVFCPGESLLVADYPDGTSVELRDGKAILQPEQADVGKRIEIREGQALFSVTDQPDHKRLSFRTPQGGGEVLGTVFSLAVAANLTTVRTFEGEVRVWNGEDPSADTNVEAGQSAYLGGTVPLAAESMDVSHLEPGGVAWVQEFHHQFPAGTNVEGNLISLQDGERFITALESIPADESHHDRSFRPDQWLSLEFFGTDRSMFTVPEEMELVVRIRAEQSGGHCLVALLPVDPRFRYEHCITKPVYLTPEWQDLVISAHQFRPYAESRPMIAGEAIRSVALWGFEAGKFEVDRILVRRGK